MANGFGFARGVNASTAPTNAGVVSSWVGNIQAQNQQREIELMNYENQLYNNSARAANELAAQREEKQHERNLELVALQQKFNADEAQKVRDWNATSYQRTMRDMKEAGLNPILAYSNGAAITGGQAATSGLTNASLAQTYMSNVADPEMDYSSTKDIVSSLIGGLSRILSAAVSGAAYASKPINIIKK